MALTICNEKVKGPIYWYMENCTYFFTIGFVNLCDCSNGKRVFLGF